MQCIQSAHCVQRAFSYIPLHALQAYSFMHVQNFILIDNFILDNFDIASVLINRNQHEISREDGLEECNTALLFLQECCLRLLWKFSETPQDREFVTSKSVVSLVIDAILLPHPFPVEDYALNYRPLDLMVVDVNGAALGCLAG